MTDMTTADAFALAPASASKTAILAAIDALVVELDTAVTATHLTDEGRIQKKADLVDWVEDLAIEMNA
jgi:hypothetical protein